MRKFLFLLPILLVRPLLAQPDTTQLNRYLADAVRQFDQPGLAVGIVKDGALVWAKGYGKLDLAKEAVVTPQTIFHMASISKAFTACAIGLLVDEGKLSFDDPVRKHMPTFATPDPYVSANMTVRDLLCHRSGWETFDDDLLWYGTGYSQPEILERHAQMPFSYSFRERFGYSNLMYIAAAQLIGQVSGQPWGQFIATRILAPLGMHRSVTDVAALQRFTDVALPHVRNGQMPDAPQRSMPYQVLPGADGAVGVYSCVTDLAKWDAMWAAGGKIGGEQFLSPRTFHELTSVQLAMSGSREGAAMGWFVETNNGKKVITHSGGMPGFILNHAVVPGKQLAVIALGNGESYNVFAATRKMLDLYLGDGKADPVATMLPRVKQLEEEDQARRARRDKARISKTRPTVALDSLVGTYTDKIYGNAVVARQGPGLSLVLSPAPGLFSGKLEHWHHDTWKWTHQDPFLEPGYITFRFNTDHRVTGFTIDLHSPDFHFHKLDFRKQGQ